MNKPLGINKKTRNLIVGIISNRHRVVWAVNRWRKDKRTGAVRG